jgi:hypothetical protein
MVFTIVFAPIIDLGLGPNCQWQYLHVHDMGASALLVGVMISKLESLYKNGYLSTFNIQNDVVVCAKTTNCKKVARVVCQLSNSDRFELI